MAIPHLLEPECRAAALLVLLTAACAQRPDRDPAAEPVGVHVAARDTGCELDAVRPSTGAPAEGLWGFDDPAASHRVAAMIGPARGAAGATRVTRTVETLESRPGADTIRSSSDTASVHLEFVPPFARPAAVYAIGPRVLLASYEPCVPGQSRPLIRYLRHDAEGRIATDVLLERQARP